MNVILDRAKMLNNAPNPQMVHPTEFASIEEERLDRKQRLAAAFRLFGLFGYDEGPAGHITVRDVEFPDRFWVNPFGLHFSRIRVSDLLLVDHDGEIIEGCWPLNRAAFAIHSRLHQARPDIAAAAHSHSMYGKAFSALGRSLKAITQDSCAFFEDHALLDDFTGVVLDLDEGDKIASTLGNRKAVILQNHGLLTTGGSVDSAAYFYIAMERCAQAQLLAEAAGEVVEIDAAVARKTHQQIGNDQAGWFGFQGLYDMIAHRCPDLFD